MITSDSKIFIDASTFMGMHSADSVVRKQSLMLMSSCFRKQIFMNLEQVGLCDAWVWGYPRDVQDDYYPFMDCLHSEMDIVRLGYSMDDVRVSLTDERIRSSGVSAQQALLTAQVINRDGILFTHDSKLRSLGWLQKHLGEFPRAAVEPNATDILFTDALDHLYTRSLCLIFPAHFQREAS